MKKVTQFYHDCIGFLDTVAGGLFGWRILV